MTSVVGVMEAPSRPRLLEQLTARRQIYRRCKTEASIPFDENVEAKRPISESSNQQIRTKIDNNEEITPSSSAFPINRTFETAMVEVKRSSQRQRSNSPRGSQKGHGQGQGQVQGQGQFSHQKAARQQQQQQQHPRTMLGRTPSSPSILLSKVREKIKEKVIETSAEWPNMAAIVQERRQKAASAFEAQLTREHLQMTKRLGKKVLGQSKSSTGEVASRAARTPLRRRSLSIDAFDSMLLGEKGKAVEICGGGGGVTCTVDDLKSITENLKHESNSDAVVKNTSSAVTVNDDDGVPESESSLTHASVTNGDDGESDQSRSHRCDESSRPSETNRSQRQPDSRFWKTSSRSDKSSEQPLQSHTALCRSSSVNVGRERLATLFANRRPSSVRRGASTAYPPGQRSNTNWMSPSKFLSRNLSNSGHDRSREIPENKRCLSLELKDRRTHRGCTEVSGRKDSSSDSNLNLKCLTNDLFDPEIIGQAIEIHLETMMRTKASSAESTVAI